MANHNLNKRIQKNNLGSPKSITLAWTNPVPILTQLCLQKLSFWAGTLSSPGWAAKLEKWAGLLPRQFSYSFVTETVIFVLACLPPQDGHPNLEKRPGLDQSCVSFDMVLFRKLSFFGWPASLPQSRHPNSKKIGLDRSWGPSYHTHMHGFM